MNGIFYSDILAMLMVMLLIHVGNHTSGIIYKAVAALGTVFFLVMCIVLTILYVARYA